MDTMWLLLRLVLSLGVVLALIWALARVKKRVSPKGASSLQVVSKIPVSRHGSLLLVEVGGKTLLLGSTDGGISVLTEVEPDEADAPVRQERTPVDFDALVMEWDSSSRSDSGSLADSGLLDAAADGDMHVHLDAPRTRADGPLTGSVLSPQTWRQLTQVLRERTLRS